MASKKFQELLNLTTEELAVELAATQKSYHKMRFDKELKGMENPILIREARRDVARILTEQRRREIEASKQA